MAKGRLPGRIALVFGLAGLIVVAIPGLWVYMMATAPVLHPHPQAAPSVTDSAPAPELAGSVDWARGIVRAHLSEKNLPGVSVAVGMDGGVLWAEGFGYADLKDRVPVTPNHRFGIGTASTVLTSAAVGLLVEEGRLKLDEEIRKYVPEFPQKEWPVTLRHVMGHTVELLQTPQRLSSGQQTGYGLGWERETVTVAGEQTVAAGHDGDLLGGMAVSLVTFPGHGLAVSVMSNISYAETNSLAVRIAEAFAKQRKQ
ncbi:MAG: beta-lactamase family protein [Acidimicrobiia bacterium]|nr:beta-lactamase family protein [Acidimicrobiia bacterium]